ncbi:probable C-mannosyltransferase DPY19L1 isoform X2 [Orussus abietinus]|nr:probable C-mannosyltransferase DPY19L1 isoform X2 [Orussus abietinus]
MYYSFYKTLVESESITEGRKKLVAYNLTEYPNIVNVEEKYCSHQELFIGTLYHISRNLGLFTEQQCWQIERGDGMPPVISCEGPGVPIYFYLNVVWGYACIMASMLFCYAVGLSGSILSGLITIACFFYNHSECTRVQWTPPLRESFAYPMLLGQMYTVMMYIKHSRSESKNDISLRGFLRTGLLEIGLTAVSLMLWQFSQFIFTTQVIIILILRWLKIISTEVYYRICIVHILSATFISVLYMTAKKYLHMCILIPSILAAALAGFPANHLDLTPKMILIEIIGTILGSHLMKALFGYEHDEHVFNILKSKLTDYKDFHTLLYTCSPEFDFLQYETYEALFKTCLLPAAVLAGILVLYYWYRRYLVEGYTKCIEPEVAYHFLQTGVFTLMAIFIMRLKLFMTPHLCLTAGLIASPRYLEKVGCRKPIIRWTFAILVLAMMSHEGFKRLKEERGYIGEYRNFEQEELFEWVRKNTPEDAAFAGKMSVMANLMLTTRRPIVNNPYYEDQEMRNRTMRVYEIYGRKDASSVYEILEKMQVDFVVLDFGSCYSTSKPGCRMLDLWDVADKGVAKNVGKPALCPMLFRGNCHPFRRVFSNQQYVVLQLGYSKSIKLESTAFLNYPSSQY